MKSAKGTYCLIFIMACALFLPAAPTDASSEKPDTIRMMLQWTHQAQFAGYYVAVDKGFYRSRGLEVEIVQGGPGLDPMDELEQGSADFASAWLSTALTRREKGLKTINIAQIVNNSNLVMINWKNSEHETPRDLQGRRISIWEGDFRAPYLAWLQSNNVVAATIYPQYYSVNLFLRKGADACSAMYYNEIHMLFQAGVDPDELTVYFLKDYGFGFPEDGIYTTENTYQRRPEMVAVFRDASIEGWRYAAEHQEETLDIVMKYVTAANVPTNRPHMKWMLENILASVMPTARDSWTLGDLNRSDYEKTVRIMREQGMLTGSPVFEEFTGRAVSRVP